MTMFDRFNFLLDTCELCACYGSTKDDCIDCEVREEQREIAKQMLEKEHADKEVEG